MVLDHYSSWVGRGDLVVLCHRSVLEAWQRTFIVLIPKRKDAVELSYYRPISLCTTLYNICAKILVGRVKPILSWLISSKQGAFIGDKSISDNILIVQEFIHDLQRASSRGSFMAIKLDIERAYDSMRWEFLF